MLILENYTNSQWIQMVVRKLELFLWTLSYCIIMDRHSSSFTIMAQFYYTFILSACWCHFKNSCSMYDKQFVKFNSSIFVLRLAIENRNTSKIDIFSKQIMWAREKSKFWFSLFEMNSFRRPKALKKWLPDPEAKFCYYFMLALFPFNFPNALRKISYG